MRDGAFTLETLMPDRTKRNAVDQGRTVWRDKAIGHLFQAVPFEPARRPPLPSETPRDISETQVRDPTMSQAISTSPSEARHRPHAPPPRRSSQSYYAAVPPPNPARVCATDINVLVKKGKARSGAQLILDMWATLSAEEQKAWRAIEQPGARAAAAAAAAAATPAPRSSAKVSSLRNPSRDDAASEG